MILAGGQAWLSVDLASAVQLVIVARAVVDGVLQFGRRIRVARVKEGDQPVYFGKCPLPQLTDSLARFLGSPLRLGIMLKQRANLARDDQKTLP